MTKDRLASVFLAVLLADVVIAVLVAVSPASVANKTLARLHHSYIVPGPFFDAKRIKYSYSFYVAWRSGGQWSRNISPAYKNFVSYNEHFNPLDLERSRYERALYQGLVLKHIQTPEQLMNDPHFPQLMAYMLDRYGPLSPDSIHIVAIKSKSRDSYEVLLDTIYAPGQK